MMQPLRAERAYRGSSCMRCHKRKVKCTREHPCRNCTLAQQPCTYAVRDRKVTVAESYLKQLEQHAVAGPAETAAAAADHPSSTKTTDTAAAAAAAAAVTAALTPLENATAEHFMSKLKAIQTPRTSSYLLGADLSWPGQGDGPGPGPGPGSGPTPTYEYFALNSDTSHEKCTFKLPPYPYAVYLINQFSIFVGHDWHWFCIRRFRRRLEHVYRRPGAAEAKDRIWLCQLLVVFSIGASISGGSLGGDAAPGLVTSREFFEQALGLLKIAYEEASVAHVETLNLMALCSYTLNRQQTAYMYAGMSARLCNLLHLHEPYSAASASAADRENRKRVWWSTFCIDRMASAQRGLFPALQAEQAAGLGLPTQDGLGDEDAEEFSDPDYLTARIQLTLLQAGGASRGQGGRGDDIDGPLRRLQAWKDGLPAHMAFGAAPARRVFATLDNLPLLRSAANLRLRYNQCVVLLLRPLLLRQITAILGDEAVPAAAPAAAPADLQPLNTICLDAARSSLEVLIRLRRYGLVARLGFMENMHLFSSLTILCLALAINTQRPGSFAARSAAAAAAAADDNDDLEDDDALYRGGKDVLSDMVAAGSLAGRGHQAMLADVEALGESIRRHGGGSGGGGGGSDTGGVGDSRPDPAPEPWDMDEWMTQLEAQADLF